MKHLFAALLCLLPLAAVAKDFGDTWGTGERETIPRRTQK